MAHRAIRRSAVTMLSVLSLALGSESGAGAIREATDDLLWTRLRIDDRFTRDAAQGALRGASDRLANPKCQSILSEFHDGRGLPLTERLAELGATAQEYLQMVVFLDATGSPQCGRSGVIAFTSRNSRVVYLCGRDFERAARRDSRETQITIIHELLHTLGLGENPPSPREISFQVLQRCSE